ncbi:DUF5677 domain-containing protein [Virgibacillus byunsanensis]|uniref:DUF5677 domain-containing protein n=1 Tax=Virgibacillus byunsanensis TaxID=570945 RepID=A0ABW3LPR3_9BACI
MSINILNKMFNSVLEESLKEKLEKGEVIDDKKLEEIIEGIYSDESLEKYTEPIFSSLNNIKSTMIEDNRLLELEFESRLQRRWMEAFHNLYAIIQIAEETGMDIIDDYLEKNNHNSKQVIKIPISFDVLIKLFAKSVVNGKEIYLLLKSGYADGAISRWRSIHETSVFFRILTSKYSDERFTEELIQRFYDYSIIENYKEYIKINRDKCSEEYYSIKKEYQKVLNTYGENFRKPYSWVKPLLPNKHKIFFGDLERLAELDTLNIYYQQSNYQIHTSPTGLYNSLGFIKDHPGGKIGAIFGPSNYGLSIPGQLTAISLMQITSSLLLLEPNLDKLVRIKILQKFVNKVQKDFDRIQNEIEDEEYDIFKNS